MNAIVSISFHTRKHAHVLEIIDEEKRLHPTTTRSKIVRNLIIEGAEAKILKQILDEYQKIHGGDWYRRFDFLKRKQQGLI